MKIKELTKELELWAPLALQESYDNAGFQVGSSDIELTGVLCTLDSTEAVVDEAIAHNCNLIIAHHPIIFKGLKSLTGKNYVERTILKAIKNDISIYASHTNLDNASNGVNKVMADKLGLMNTSVLAPLTGKLKKLTTYIPNQKEQLDSLLSALYKAGAGEIGNYSACSFQVKGNGTFTPNEAANPTIGNAYLASTVEEVRIEVVYPFYKEAGVINALFNNHPYEEVAYYISSVDNDWKQIGAGIIGSLPIPLEYEALIDKVKRTFNLSYLKSTKQLGNSICKVAFCGGSGSFLLQDAIRAGAEVFITSDFKYHEFFDAENKIVILDIGHFESETLIRYAIAEFCKEKFPNIAVRISETQTNPVSIV